MHRDTNSWQLFLIADLCSCLTRRNTTPPLYRPSALLVGCLPPRRTGAAVCRITRGTDRCLLSGSVKFFLNISDAELVCTPGASADRESNTAEIRSVASAGCHRPGRQRSDQISSAASIVVNDVARPSARPADSVNSRMDASHVSNCRSRASLPRPGDSPQYRGYRQPAWRSPSDGVDLGAVAVPLGGGITRRVAA